jgi:ankyrin repeat protein
LFVFHFHSDQNRTALMHASGRGDYDIVSALLRQGEADPDMQDLGVGLPFLVVSVVSFHFSRLSLVSWCVQGMTALHWAASKGHSAVVELLLAHGAIVDLKNKKVCLCSLFDSCSFCFILCVLRGRWRSR